MTENTTKPYVLTPSGAINKVAIRIGLSLIIPIILVIILIATDSYFVLFSHFITVAFALWYLAFMVSDAVNWYGKGDKKIGKIFAIGSAIIILIQALWILYFIWEMNRINWY